MRTHIEINDQLLEEAMQLGGLRTRTAAVQAALETYVHKLKIEALVNMGGKVHWEGDLDAWRRDRNLKQRVQKHGGSR